MFYTNVVTIDFMYRRSRWRRIPLYTLCVLEINPTRVGFCTVYITTLYIFILRLIVPSRESEWVKRNERENKIMCRVSITVYKLPTVRFYIKSAPSYCIIKNFINTYVYIIYINNIRPLIEYKYGREWLFKVIHTIGLEYNLNCNRIVNCNVKMSIFYTSIVIARVMYTIQSIGLKCQCGIGK